MFEPLETALRGNIDLFLAGVDDDPEYLEEVTNALYELAVKYQDRLEAVCAEIDEGFKCLDCAVSTHDIGEYYMVENSVWTEAVPEGEGMLCIACLENRLGRLLTEADFTGAPINTHPRDNRSARLQSRLGMCE